MIDGSFQSIKTLVSDWTRIIPPAEMNMPEGSAYSIYNLFQYLKSQFQFALIVSHIDSMRDTVDTLLEVKKENGFSNINFD